MATISTVEDIIATLDSDPQLLEALRARLLTRELLELPQVVAQLAASQAEMRKDMDRFAAEQATMRKDMDRFAAEQAEMRKDMDRFAAEQATMRKDMDRFAAEQVEMRKDMDRFAAEQAEMRKDMDRFAAEQATMRKDMDRFAAEQATMRKDIERLAAEQAEMRKDIERLAAAQAKTAADVAALQADVAVLKDDVASLKGDHLEMRLQGKVHAMLGQRKSLRGIRVVCAAFPAGMAPEFVDAIDNAADEDKITEDQRGRILSTDLIATARRRRSRQPIYVSFEVAHSLDEDDARRVVETGDALARVFPKAEVMSFIYGQSISERDKAQAEAKGVEVVVERAAR